MTRRRRLKSRRACETAIVERVAREASLDYASGLGSVYSIIQPEIGVPANAHAVWERVGARLGQTV